MKVIITSIQHKYKYIMCNITLTQATFNLVQKLKKEYDWFLEVVADGSTIQGVLDTDDLDVGIDIAYKILDLDPITTVMLSVGDVIKDSKNKFSMSVRTNHSKAFVNPGRLLDNLVKEDETPGIFYLDENNNLEKLD